MAKDEGYLIQFEEESEGDRVATDDFIFRRIGEPVPLRSLDSSFDLEDAPVQPLAISEIYRVIFLAHSEGFCIVKTKDVIELAKEIKKKGERKCIQESCVLDVSIGPVSILALSTDSSTLAATSRENIHLFSVGSLLRKEPEPLSSRSLADSNHVKDFKWRKDVENSYIVLSRNGILYHGDLNGSLKHVMENVDAVDWSVKGDNIAVARNDNVCILSSEFKEQFHMSLLFQSWNDDTDTNCIVKVDSIKWVRHDSIIIGCTRLNEDGQEDGYLVHVITKNGSDITEVSPKPVVRSFIELFSGVIDDVLPSGSGPHLLVCYLDRWELAIAANRKNTDQHIALLGWSLDDKQGLPVGVEFRQDKGVPRIELQENGDDNLILGFGIDKVSLYEKVEIKNCEEVRELSPCCILICVTSDGKLVMFHVARMSDTSDLPQNHFESSGNIAGTEGVTALAHSAFELLDTLKMENHGIGQLVSDGKAFCPKKRENVTTLEVAHASNESSQTITANKEPRDILNPQMSNLDREQRVSSIKKHDIPGPELRLSGGAFHPKESENVTTLEAAHASNESSHTITANKEPRDILNPQLSKLDSEQDVSSIKKHDIPGSELRFSGEAFHTKGKENVTTHPKEKENVTTLEVTRASNESSQTIAANKEPRDILNPQTSKLDREQGVFSIKKHGIPGPELRHSGEAFHPTESNNVTTLEVAHASNESSQNITANKEETSKLYREQGLSSIKSHDIPGSELRLSGRESSNLAEISLKSNPVQDFGSAVIETKMATQTISLAPTTSVGDVVGFPIRGLPSDTSSVGNPGPPKSDDVGKLLTKTVGVASFPITSSGSLSSEKLSVNDVNTRLSSFGSYGSIQKGHGYKNFSTGTSSSTHVPAYQRSPSAAQSGSRGLKDTSASKSSSFFPSERTTKSEGQRGTFTKVGNGDIITSVHSHSGSSAEVSMMGKSQNSRGFLNNNRAHRSPVLFSSELDLSNSFCSVSEMANELDTLLSDIEKEGGFRDACTAYQRSSVLELEEGLEKLSQSCRLWKNTMDQRLKDIKYLQDKTAQVLARIIYVEAIVKQASNNQYWELWNRQKLSPEFELKQHQIRTVHQSLMNQLVALEKHFNALELNKFGENNGAPMGWRASSSLKPARQVHSLHSLYNTMNSQLAAAEQLSECLSKQMAVLKIESPPAKPKSIREELFQSIGLVYDGEFSRSSGVKSASCTPDSTKKLPFSSFSAIKEQTRRNMTDDLKGFEPETARRRRDSLDRNWTTFEPQKTTVKRMLQEERSRVNMNNSYLGSIKDSSNFQMEGRLASDVQKGCKEDMFSPFIQSASSEQPNIIPVNREIHGKSLIQASESLSIALFKWAKDHSGTTQTGGSKSPSIQPIHRSNASSPSAGDVVVSPTSLWSIARENSDASESSGVTRALQSIPSTLPAALFSETRPGLPSRSPTRSQTSSGFFNTSLPIMTVSPKDGGHLKADMLNLYNQENVPSLQVRQTAASMKNGAVSPQMSFSMTENIYSSVASDAAAAPTGMTGETLLSTTLSSRNHFGEAVSIATVMPTNSLSAPPFLPPISLSDFSSSLPIPALGTQASSPPPFSMAFEGSLPTTEPGRTTNHSVASPPTSSVSSTSSHFFSPGSFPLQPLPATKPGTDEIAPSWPSTSATTTPLLSSSSGSFLFQLQKPHAPPTIPEPPKSVTVEPATSQSTLAVSEDTRKLEPAASVVPDTKVSAGLSPGSQPRALGTASTPSTTSATPSVAPNSTPEMPPAASSLSSSRLLNTATEVKNEGTDVTIAQEDEMDEEAPDTTTELSLGSLSGFGIGSSPTPGAPKVNPFGGSFAAPVESTPFSLTVPSGELFRPPSFSFQSLTPTPPPQSINSGGFSGGFGNFTPARAPTASGFGQPAQIGAGQQAMGSVLGAFGQSRQLGTGLPGAGFASPAGGGFGSAGGGFGNATAGVGFAGVASTGGAFAGAASAGGGFAAAAAASGGFAAAASAGGGFGAFSSKQTTGPFSSFGGSNAMASGKPAELFTQMRR